MNTFKTEEHKKEFVAAFKKLTMSGAVSQDVAIARLIKNNPHFFHQPDEAETKKNFNAAMNQQIRSRALQQNNLQIFQFQPKTAKNDTP